MILPELPALFENGEYRLNVLATSKALEGFLSFSLVSQCLNVHILNCCATIFRACQKIQGKSKTVP